jgi:hypothetical protein
MKTWWDIVWENFHLLALFADMEQSLSAPWTRLKNQYAKLKNYYCPSLICSDFTPEVKTGG